jgi:hypothetical protein
MYYYVDYSNINTKTDSLIYDLFILTGFKSDEC